MIHGHQRYLPAFRGLVENRKGQPVKLAVWVTLTIFVLDQASKYVVVHLMDLARLRAIDVLPPYLNFRMAWNYGVNFGLFAGEGEMTRWVLIGLSIAICLWVWRWVMREGAPRGMQVSAGLLVGGALGNVVDRIFYGAVADFLNMSCCGINNPFAFNVADVAIFAGAAGLVLLSGGDAAPKRSRRS